jgi:hypothetical protein
MASRNQWKVWTWKQSALWEGRGYHCRCYQIGNSGRKVWKLINPFNKCLLVSYLLYVKFCSKDRDESKLTGSYSCEAINFEDKTERRTTKNMWKAWESEHQTTMGLFDDMIKLSFKWLLWCQMTVAGNLKTNLSLRNNFVSKQH